MAMETMTPSSVVYMEDCVEAMKRYPDKYFDLAVVDPPYGIKADQKAYKNGITCKANGFKEYSNKNWDDSIPNKFAPNTKANWII